jgi:hypothetical protein
MEARRLVGGLVLALLACDTGRERDLVLRVEAQARAQDASACAQLVPRELRDRMAKGLTMGPGPKSLVGTVSCLLPEGVELMSILSGKVEGIHITYMCAASIPDTMDRAVERYGGTPVAGLGKRALSWPPMQMKFWDAETPCVVDVVTSLGGEHLLPLARELEVRLTPATAAAIH